MPDPASSSSAPEASSGIDSALRQRWTKYRGKAVKSALGLLLLAMAARHAQRALVWTLSDEAMVTAPFITVSAPIDGYLEHGVAGLGSFVSPDAPVGRIVNPLADRGPVARLEAESRSLDGELAALQRQIDALSALTQQFKRQGDVFLSQRKRTLGLALAEQEARVEGARATREAGNSALARHQALTSAGAATERELEEVRRVSRVADSSFTASLKELERQQQLLEGARAGLVLSESTGTERGYSSQRSDEIALRLTSLISERDERQARQGAVERQLSLERDELGKKAAATLGVAARVRVWDVLAENGEYVTRGRPLFKLVDCPNAQVVSLVTARKYRALREGQSAEIELLESGVRHAGRITLLLGRHGHGRLPAPWADGDSTDGAYAVVVSSQSLARALGASCQIGQSAEVRFF